MSNLPKTKPIQVAILDMNDGFKNQGIGCIYQLLENSQNAWKERHHYLLELEIKHFRVRDFGEVPKHSFDIYISSGGPGSPHDGEGKQWEVDYFQLLDDILEHNLSKSRKTFFFGICHSFQVLTRHFKFAEVCDAPRSVYGIMPAYPTPSGLNSFILEGLGERFFAFERRNYQVVHPDESALEAIGAKVLALESRHGLRGKAIMTLSIGEEFQATQFHPEADRDSILRNFLDPEKREHILAHNGEELFNKMLASLQAEDRVKRTHDLIMPRFLAKAYHHLLEVDTRKATRTARELPIIEHPETLPEDLLYEV
jgi:GMP synthase-like glutamine amidotransferase